MNPIGFNAKTQQQEKDVWKEINLINKRLDAIENNLGNYQLYLKLKEQFERKE